jgi:hypothetical protein
LIYKNIIKNGFNPTLTFIFMNKTFIKNPETRQKIDQYIKISFVISGAHTEPTTAGDAQVRAKGTV